MLHVVTPSLSVVSSQPSTSKSAEASSSTDKADPAYLEIDEDLKMRSNNLSATLQKLHLWEKKLYNEVKVCWLLLMSRAAGTKISHPNKISKLDIIFFFN